MKFGHQGQCTFLSLERTLRVADDNNDLFGPEHLEFEVCIVRDSVKAHEHGTAKQSVITAVEGDNVED